METEDLGLVFNEDHSLGVTTKNFMRGNPKWCFAEIAVHLHTTFPSDMLRYDDCEICPGYEHMPVQTVGHKKRSDHIHCSSSQTPIPSKVDSCTMEFIRMWD